MTCPVCHGTDQGRNCPACLNATRAALGLHRIDPLDLARRQGFLYADDGGHRVHGDDTVRLAAPAPVESSGASVGFLVVAISSIAAAAIGVFLCYLKSSCI